MSGRAGEVILDTAIKADGNAVALNQWGKSPFLAKTRFREETTEIILITLN